jgi:hypothetical protein
MMLLACAFAVDGAGRTAEAGAADGTIAAASRAGPAAAAGGGAAERAAPTAAAAAWCAAGCAAARAALCWRRRAADVLAAAAWTRGWARTGGFSRASRESKKSSMSRRCADTENLRVAEKGRLTGASSAAARRYCRAAAELPSRPWRFPPAPPDKAVVFLISRVAAAMMVCEVLWGLLRTAGIPSLARTSESGISIAEDVAWESWESWGSASEAALSISDLAAAMMASASSSSWVNLESPLTLELGCRTPPLVLKRTSVSLLTSGPPLKLFAKSLADLLLNSTRRSCKKDGVNKA